MRDKKKILGILHVRRRKNEKNLRCEQWEYVNFNRYAFTAC